jgi:glycine reductase
MVLQDKIVIALGERDGIPGPALAEVAKSGGARDVVLFTLCFA